MMRFSTRSPGRRCALGAWIKLPGTESTEIIASAGFDFAVVDMEHTLLDASAVERHLVLGQALGMPMLVRVPDAIPSLIQRLLDGGADGIFVPHVDDPIDAERAVASSTFPPRGTRGSGGTSRAGDFGLRSRLEYLASGGGIIAQIESVASMRAIEPIVATEGLGAVMLGPADLGLDPLRGELGSIAEVADSLVTSARSAGIAVGIACSPADVPAQRDAGFDFIVCANDVTLLATAAHEVIRSLDTGQDYSYE